MRRFQFRLETLLEVRRRLEEQAQLDLMSEEAVLAGLQSQREYLQQAIRTQQARLVFPREATLSLEEVRQDHFMLEHLEQAVADKDRQIDRCREKLEQLKQTLVERRRERETVEKLKERDFADWQQETARLDQSALDEVSSIAFNRRRREAGEVRTWMLFGIMMALVIFLIYVTGTRSGRSWMDEVSRRMANLQISRPAGQTTAGGVSSATGALALHEEPVEPAPSLESVRRERERLSRWEAQLESRQQQVEMELIALSEIRDEIAARQSEVDQKVVRLNKLLEQQGSIEAQERSDMLDKLAKLYANTKAKDAARLLMERDLETTVEIIRRMNEKDLVKILEEMNKLGGQPGGPSGPERATELLDLYAEKALQKSRS